MKGSDLIENAFSSARDNKSRALIGFLTAGDPSPRHTLRLAGSLIQGGVDILELGIPFSDPLADGPTIQAADNRALMAGATAQSTLGTVQALREKELTTTKHSGEEIPVVLLSYLNPILKFGVNKFLRNASKSGVNGLVVPDLTFATSRSENQRNGNDDREDARVFSRAASKYEIALVMMAAPTTPSSRLSSLISKTEGFLYFVSLLGVTGSRKAAESIDQSNLQLIRNTSKLAKKKSKNIAVGFGISRPEQVKDVLHAGADGAIVGSFFVNLVASNLDDIDQACKLLTKSARKLKEATHVSYGSD